MSFVFDIIVSIPHYWLKFCNWMGDIVLESKPTLWLLRALKKAVDCVIFVIFMAPSIVILALQNCVKRRKP
jgi:hypothetical protein